MFTYDVVSVSVRNPNELAAELTRRSSEGWEVVQIAFDGAAWFHAFIRHQGNVPITTHPDMKAEQLVPVAGGSTPASTSSTSFSSTSSSSLGSPQSASAPSDDAAPANWYKDPSGRFELRYWNGAAWTEHVATAGKQSTDQPQS